jgi:hypothetical protein
MTADERETVRLLVEAYAFPIRTDGDVEAANAHAENAEQDLPWGQDWDRACHLQDVALRAARIVKARRA